jgi:hypothetical protein
MLLIFSVIGYFTGLNAYAQHDGIGHGGGISEGDLKHFIFKLDHYLYTAEGKEAFPETNRYSTNMEIRAIASVISMKKGIAILNVIVKF